MYIQLYVYVRCCSTEQSRSCILRTVGVLLESIQTETYIYTIYTILIIKPNRCTNFSNLFFE